MGSAASNSIPDCFLHSNRTRLVTEKMFLFVLQVLLLGLLLLFLYLLSLLLFLLWQVFSE